MIFKNISKFFYAALNFPGICILIINIFLVII